MAPSPSTQTLTSTTEDGPTVLAALASERPGSPAADVAPAVKATPDPAPVDLRPSPVAEPPTEVPAKVEEPAAAPETPAKPTDVDPDAEAELTPEEEASQAGKKLASYKGAYKKRLDKLLKDRRERDERLAKLEAELAKLKPATPDPTAEDPDATPIPKPAIDDFDTVADHTEALIDWKEKEKARVGRIEAKAKAAADAQAAAEQADTEAYQALVTNFVTARDAAKARYPDWDEVMETAKALTVADKPMLQHAIAESDIAGDLLYHFGKHPEVFDEIVALGPSKGLMKLGQIEDKIRARVGGLTVAGPGSDPVVVAPAPAPAAAAAPAVPIKPATPPVPVSRAPEPMPAVGAGATQTAVDPNIMTHAQYKAWRAAGGGR